MAEKLTIKKISKYSYDWAEVAGNLFALIFMGIFYSIFFVSIIIGFLLVRFSEFIINTIKKFAEPKSKK